MFARILIAAALCATLASPSLARSKYPARAEAARPGERVFTLINDHQPTRLLQAARSAEDTLKRGGREAQIMLNGRAIMMVIPGFTNVSKQVMDIKSRNPRLRITACKETVDVLTKANRRPPPLMRGVNVEPCRGRAQQLQSAGWQRMLGI
jgi:hypothetical protein